jgi:hypothetical protein
MLRLFYEKWRLIISFQRSDEHEEGESKNGSHFQVHLSPLSAAKGSLAGESRFLTPVHSSTCILFMFPKFSALDLLSFEV